MFTLSETTGFFRIHLGIDFCGCRLGLAERFLSETAQLFFVSD